MRKGSEIVKILRQDRFLEESPLEDNCTSRRLLEKSPHISSMEKISPTHRRDKSQA